MFEIVKGDNTGAFGNCLLQVNLHNPKGVEFSKAVVQIGCVNKSFENPIFPLLVNLNGYETNILNFQNDCSLAVWDKKGRKSTPKGNLTIYATDEKVHAIDTPLNTSDCSAGVGATVDFDIDSDEIQAIFSIDVSPAYLSELVNDVGFITKDVNDLTNYTNTTQLNSLLNDKVDLSDFDTLQTVVEENTDNINSINEILPSKANDNNVVHLTGNEVIDGDKTFQSKIIIGLDGSITCHQGFNLINEVNNKVIVGNGREELNITSFGRATVNNKPIATDTTVASDISNHNTDETAHPHIQGLIITETTDRENAVNELQEQIDSLVASSNVKDYVNTYAELQSYDTSTLGNNDIIVVLTDSTHNNATSYYRWITADNAFSYIGSISAYYTKSESDDRFVPKTRLVNGKPLSTDIELTAEDVGALPSSTVIPTVNNGVLTIRVNDETEATFTANQSTNTLLNIDVPTQISELINDLNYVTNANYATTSTGGVIKTALTAGSSVDNNGVLQSVIRTQQQYNTDANVMFISKGTLENIKGTLVSSVADNKYETKLDVQLLRGAVI